MTPLEIVLSAAFIFCLCAYIRHLYRSKQQLEHQTQNNIMVVQEYEEKQKRVASGLLDALQDGLLIVSEEGRILQSNKNAKTIFGKRSLKNRALEEALLEPLLIAPIRESLKGNDESSQLITLPSSSLPGTSTGHRAESHWLIQTSPVVSEDTNSRTLVVLRDVSENIHSDQVRKDFVANASHELRTPLSIIQGYLENLIEDNILSDPEYSRHILGIMEKHVDRINRLVEDMLVISRLESGEETALNVAPFQISSCIKDVIERLDPLIKSQDAKVSSKIDPQSLLFEGDRFYWTQVIFNLVENALKQNSAIAVKVKIAATKTEDDWLQLDIIDNGVGIPSNDIPYIFKRFFRVEKHHSQGEIKGTGLGLSIVKRAVEAHGGEIIATSTPGVETRFSIKAPLFQPEQDQE